AEPRFRDAAEAFALARRAVELAPENGACWLALGVAHYRAGDHEGAVTTLQKARALRDGGNSFDGFFLALAHRQLGNKQEARKGYDQASRWMEKNQPQNEELLRLRAEAEELLGIKEKQD
ncbi:MAG TPA: tetratricopeptide repeat protein, partial [Gemmataceae bacterium]|nr:tetratricopeptide repeat protein [Gemmataceae bacterium]